MLERRALDADLERRRQQAERERERIALETQRETRELEAAMVRLAREATVDVSEARLHEILLTQTLLEVAKAFRGSFDRVHVTSGEGSSLFAVLSAGIEQVLDIAKLPAPRVGAAKKENDVRASSKAGSFRVLAPRPWRPARTEFDAARRRG